MHSLPIQKLFQKTQTTEKETLPTLAPRKKIEVYAPVLPNNALFARLLDNVMNEHLNKIKSIVPVVPKVMRQDDTTNDAQIVHLLKSDKQSGDDAAYDAIMIKQRDQQILQQTQLTVQTNEWKG